jgi:hypothetical protein
MSELITPDIKRLRVESGDGTCKDYRIVGGSVEVRNFAAGEQPDDNTGWWWTLRPEQLSEHVERNTVVAQWLERRLGWRQLLRACVGEELRTGDMQKPQSGNAWVPSGVLGLS